MVLLQLKDPLERFAKGREFLPGSMFLSRLDMTEAVESDVKPQFLPSFLPMNQIISTAVLGMKGSELTFRNELAGLSLRLWFSKRLLC